MTTIGAQWQQGCHPELETGPQKAISKDKGCSTTCSYTLLVLSYYFICFSLKDTSKNNQCHG